MRGLGSLQRLGKSLMLPIAVLPAAGLLNRLGAGDVWNIPFINAGGNALFSYLALLFAMGIAIGLSKDGSGSAAISGAIVYFILNFGATGVDKTINMGVFAGFIAGLFTPILYNRLYDKFTGNPYFNGRHVAILVNAVAAILLVLLFGLIWPYIQNILDSVNGWITSAGALGAAVFGFANRMLIPTGLHHVLNTYLWFGFGTFHEATGDINRFFAGDPSAGTYQVGFFPIMMFGLPGAALAMVLTAKKDRRKETFGMMLSVALTAFLTGITEPIEFSFMFLAYPLYVVHALLAGLSGLITNLLGIKLGFSFSAGAIDFMLNFTQGTRAWELIPIGLVFFLIYFVIFYWAIKKFDIKTPGRGDESLFAFSGPGTVSDQAEIDSKRNTVQDKYQFMAEKIFDGIGGDRNLDQIDYCTTRLRLKLNDTSQVDEQAIKRAGVRGVFRIDKRNLQIIIGTEVEFVADALKKMIGRPSNPAHSKEGGKSHPENGTERVFAPATGELVPLTDVPDPVFSQGMMGQGIAIRPENGIFVAPADGELVQLAETKHAFGIRTRLGEEILVHIGLDTVNLKGEGFQTFVKAGDHVSVGQRIIKGDLDIIRSQAKSDLSIMVVTNSMDHAFTMEWKKPDRAVAGKTLLYQARRK
ncbi:glucose PTS transporter subunit IIA [Sporolactobacillus sp. THM19-2]|uniref:glucose PTS transporter subunit IIA n=1 Tax=Sporolactobacillus sp. THM19-2 TaxID=2511171 RepID=UPI0010218392|nr:glucose PTS transporter subunit IIA [Sporolactobacillus sp. THM19-2]RYL94469.1 PTS mannose transporter subunit IIC [Sporolactobacillus sp. THM19-2]